jgi:hypothetical protein
MPRTGLVPVTGLMAERQISACQRLSASSAPMASAIGAILGPGQRTSQKQMINTVLASVQAGAAPLLALTARAFCRLPSRRLSARAARRTVDA